MRRFVLFLALVGLFGCVRSAAATTGSAGAIKGAGMWSFPGTKLPEIAATWYYDWTPRARGADGAFIPMVWGDRDNNRASYDAVRLSAAPAVLGYNEPDGCDQGAQACMSPYHAGSLWAALADAASGKSLGSPAVASNFAWLDNFFGEITKRGARFPDFIAVHHYPNLGALSADAAAAEVVGVIDYAHQRYGKPVWLTEVGSLYETEQWRIDAFIRALVPKLDALPYLQRYAWFSDHAYRGYARSALWNDDGSLAETGWVYKCPSCE